MRRRVVEHSLPLMRITSSWFLEDHLRGGAIPLQYLAKCRMCRLTKATGV